MSIEMVMAMKTLQNHQETEQDAPVEAPVEVHGDHWMDVARRAVAELLGEPGERTFDVRYWNGFVEHGASREDDLSLVLNRPGSLRRMFLPASELALGEAYVRGDFDIIGDVGQATALRDVLGTRLRSPRRIAVW